MKIASTAADAAVEAPNTSRSMRSQAVWHTRAQKPELKSRSATRTMLSDGTTGPALCRSGTHLAWGSNLPGFDDREGSALLFLRPSDHLLFREPTRCQTSRKGTEMHYLYIPF